MIHGGGLNGGDPVDLANGDHLYLPAPDIAAYNPTGPSVLYRRNYSSACAKTGYHSPGLSCGWVDNFDVRIGQYQDAPSYNVVLAFPTGGQDTLTPDDKLPGNFVHESDRPYVAKGVLDLGHGCYSSIDVTWKDGTVWTFTPAWDSSEQEVSYKPYYLTTISNRVGKKVGILRAANGAVLEIHRVDLSGIEHILLNFNYGEGGYLRSIRDFHSGRKVIYIFGDRFSIISAEPEGEYRIGYSCSEQKQLSYVSQLVDESVESNPPVHWSYNYTWVGRLVTDPSGIELHVRYPLLNKIYFPNPSGGLPTTQTVTYQMDSSRWPRVESITDGNGHVHTYDFDVNGVTETVADQICHTCGSGSQPAGVASQRTKYQFNIGADGRPEIAQIDVMKSEDTSYSTYYEYSNSSKSGMPSLISNNASDGSDRIVGMFYDEFGNITYVWTSGCRQGVYNYEYPESQPMGRLVDIYEDGVIKTVLHYNNQGLVDEIYTLKPTANLSTGLVYVKTSVAYNAFGDIVSVTTPRAGAGVAGTAVFEYTYNDPRGQGRSPMRPARRPRPSPATMVQSPKRANR